VTPKRLDDSDIHKVNDTRRHNDNDTHKVSFSYRQTIDTPTPSKPKKKLIFETNFPERKQKK